MTSVPPIDLDAAMRLYLSGADSGGYEPIRAEARLREAFGDQASSVKSQLDRYLAAVMSWETNWATETLSVAATRVENRIADEFPQFEPLARRAMSNYFAYQWK